MPFDFSIWKHTMPGRLLHGFGPLEITFLVTDKTKRIFHASQPEESVVTCKRSIT